MSEQNTNEEKQTPFFHWEDYGMANNSLSFIVGGVDVAAVDYDPDPGAIPNRPWCLSIWGEEQFTPIYIEPGDVGGKRFETLEALKEYVESRFFAWVKKVNAELVGK